jgi:RNA polymerase I-specific transcription initiation factor RRN6
LTYDDVFGQFDTPQHVTHIHMDWLHYRGDEHLPSSGPGSSYSQHDVQFYRLSVMLSDLSIRQAIFYTHSPSLETIPNRRLSIEPTAWTNIIHARGTILLSEDLVGLGDDFIIPDGIDTASVPALKTREGPILPPMQSRGPSRNEKYRENASTVNYSDIYDALTGTTHWSMTGDGPLIETEDVSSVIARLRTVLFGGSDQNELLPGTMMETCDTAIRVTDVDDASLQIQELLDQNDRSHPFEAQRVAFLQSSQPGAPNDHQGDMSSLYDSILQHWIASLPASIPSRTRQMKERQARRIAAEVVLASSRIRRPIAVEPELLPPSSKDWPTAGLGQVHEVSMSSQRSVDFTGLPHLPEPSSSQPASQQTAPTHPNAITRLGQHLQITKPPPTMSPNISQVLMHWHPGADPRVYDWDATTRLINAESNIDELGQKQRERSKRKAERLLKKQMRELELEKRKAESQPVFGRVVGGLRSSPAPVVGLGLSSQTQTESSQDQSQSQGIGVPHIVQSQIEPGRHGGKPQVKKRKGKARVSGF